MFLEVGYTKSIDTSSYGGPLCPPAFAVGLFSFTMCPAGMPSSRMCSSCMSISVSMSSKPLLRRVCQGRAVNGSTTQTMGQWPANRHVVSSTALPGPLHSEQQYSGGQAPSVRDLETSFSASKCKGAFANDMRIPGLEAAQLADPPASAYCTMPISRMKTVTGWSSRRRGAPVTERGTNDFLGTAAGHFMRKQHLSLRTSEIHATVHMVILLNAGWYSSGRLWSPSCT